MNAQTLLNAPETRAFAASKLAARSLMLGGALWIAHYALQVGMGLSSGQFSMTGTIGTLDGACFCGAILGICAGVSFLAAPMRPRAALSNVGLSFAIIAAFSITFGFARAVTTGQQPSILGAIGVIGSCLSAIFVALAAKRAGALSPRLANSLFCIGLLTFPLIVAFSLPAGKWFPAFWTDELPFALSGAAYLALGRALRSIH